MSNSCDEEKFAHIVMHEERVTRPEWQPKEVTRPSSISWGHGNVIMHPNMASSPGCQ